MQNAQNLTPFRVFRFSEHTHRLASTASLLLNIQKQARSAHQVPDSGALTISDEDAQL